MVVAPIKVALYGEPVAKGRPRFVRATGATYTPAHTRRYEAMLRLAAQEAMGERHPLDGALAMVVRVMLPIPKSFSKRRRVAAQAGKEHPAKRPDWDNYAKLAADALNGVVFSDDSQIVDARVLKLYGVRPGMAIEVRHMP